MSKLVRDYYIIDIPGDCCETIDELANLAINEARERAKLYCVPANWEAKLISGELGSFNVRFRVKRTRNRAASHAT